MVDADRDLYARDAMARRRAQMCFSLPFALEAGAGTGKTTALVARVVVWCLGEGWERASRRLGTDPDRVAPAVLSAVVAITFTEAAAAEMEERIGQAFLAVARSGAAPGVEVDLLPEPPARVHRAHALRAALDHLVVRTIHAFCRRLLASYPLEAGLDPGFTVDADETQLEALVVETVAARATLAYGDPMEPDFLTLARAGIGPREVAEALLELARVGTRPAALAEDPFSPERVRAAADELRDRLQAFRRGGGNRLQRLGGRAQRTVTTANALDHFERGLAESLVAPDAAWLCSRARDLMERAGARLGEWAQARFNDSEREALGGAEEDFARRAEAVRGPLKALAEGNPTLHASARRVLGPLLTRVESTLRARGIATFSSLLADCARLLAAEPAVLARVRGGIEQLLVDELQDTDRVQCAIVRALALDGEDPRPGLFVVGDPKQSIYGWRSADLAAYEDLLAAVRARGGEVHQLTVNFRSVPAILAEVDRVIAPIMRARSGLQPAYQELVATPARAAAPGVAAVDPDLAAVEHWISLGWDEPASAVKSKTSAIDAATVEARGIAHDLLRLRARGVAWRRTAILLRSTGDLAIYLTALRHAGVSYEVARDRGYYQRREVIEAAALLRVVLDPNDTLALVTLMRSAWVGVPDAAFLPLWERGFPGHMADLTSPRGRRLAKAIAAARSVGASDIAGVPGIDRVRGWGVGLIHMIRAIADLRERIAVDAPDDLVMRLRRLFSIEALEATRYLGRYRVANLERFFRGVLQALESSSGDVQAVLRHVRESVAEARAAEEARPQDVLDDAVSVLTIHQAKGLDFDHVYVAQLHKGRPGGASLATRADEVDGHLELALFGIPSLRFDRALARREAVEAAERVRTLYVAMTRARERLVMLGKPGTGSHDGGPLSDPDHARSYADLLLARRPVLPDPATVMPEHAVRPAHRPGGGPGGGFAYTDVAAARLRFPALLPEPVPEAGSRSRPAALSVSGSAARQLAETLRTRRTQAAARMARGLGGTASGEAHRDDPAESMANRFREEAEGVERGKGAAVAAAVGSAIHRVLETFDLGADADREGERQERQLADFVSSLLGDEQRPAGVDRAGRFLKRLLASDCLRRLRELREHVVARELSLLMAPPSLEAGALGFVTGAIDLLYRDPATHQLVVVDYKTDEVESPFEVSERVARYAPQGEIYTRGVREALDLPTRPRFELWFLHADRIVVVPLLSADG